MTVEIENAEPEPNLYESPKYKIYLQETSGYAQEKLEIFKIIPTIVVSISTFMFGGSIWAINAFNNPHRPWLLVATWICLAISISMMLLELLLSLRAYEKAGEISGTRFRTDDYEAIHRNVYATACEWLQNLMFLVFILAIFLFLSFFCSNLSTPRSSNVGSKAQIP